MTDVFANYEKELISLLKRLGKEHARYAEALTLQTRLLENIAHARLYGDSETRRADRAQIVDGLNQLSLDTIGEAFTLEISTHSFLARISKKPVFTVFLIGVVIVFSVAWLASQLRDKHTFDTESVMVTPSAFIPTVSSNTQTPIIEPGLPVSVTMTIEPMNWFNSIAVPIKHTTCLTPDNWLVAGRDPSNNTYTGYFLALPLQAIWEAESGQNLGKPIVVDQKVYLADESGEVFGIDAITGKIVWQKQFGPLVGDNIGLSYSGGVLSLASYYGTVYGIDSTSGQLKWSYHANSTINSSPVAFEDKLFVGTWDGELLALDAKTGVLLWQFKAGEVFNSDVAAQDNTVYVFTRDGILYALEVSSGEEIWSVAIGGGTNGRTPVISGKTLYINSPSSVVALDSETGKISWVQHLKGLFSVQSVSVDDFLVYVSIPQEYELVALDVKTGDIRWRTELPGPPANQGPVVASRYLFTRMRAGGDVLIALDKYQGTLLWQEELNKNSSYADFPSVVVANHLLLINVGNSLLAFEPSLGRLLYSGSNLRIWDPAQGRVLELRTQVYLRDCAPLSERPNLILGCVGVDRARSDLYTVDWDTRKITRITDFRAKGIALSAISPDRNFAAFAFGTGGIFVEQGSLYVVDLQNRLAMLVTDSFVGDSNSLSWSPDSQWLAYATKVSDGADRIIKVYSNNQDKLTTIAPQGFSGGLSWSPDGNWIAYETNRGLEIASRDGRQVEPISEFGGGFILWSPSGQEIASEPWVEKTTGIYVTSVDGRSGKWIARYNGNVFPGHNPYSWSLDGRYIAYLASMEEIRILDVCTGNLLESIDLGNEYTNYIAWIP